MFLDYSLGLALFIISSIIIFRILFKTSVIHKLKRCSLSLEDWFFLHQYYKIPQYNDYFQENQLYRKISMYLNSLSSDSDFTSLITGPKSNDIILSSDINQVIHDKFLGARVSWTNEKSPHQNLSQNQSFVLKIRKTDKRRVLKPYFQHIFSVCDEIDQKGKESRLFVNIPARGSPENCRRWMPVPFSHPATFDTVVMDSDVKNKVKADLESFVKSKNYYHKLGRVWKRSYLLYGPYGTGKSSFIAAMAKFLCYDVYDIDISKVLDDSDLKMLLMQTTSKSLIVVEDLDRYLEKKSTDGSVSMSGLLSFMDGIISGCGEERIMVFTMNGRDKDQVDQAVLRPGRIDVHIHFPLCDFPAFKSLAVSYLGVKEHKLFPQVEEIFQSGPCLSPAHIGEIMITNRSSPTRALKSVITALQTCNEARPVDRTGQRLTGSGSQRSSDESGEPPSSVICRESVHTVREIRKLYGLFRIGSRRKESVDLDAAEKEASKLEG